MSLCAFGGGELHGEKLVRFVYLDEAGIANPKHEPFVVVAGVIIHADKQWKAIENYLKDMIADLIPEDRRNGFFFHAKDQFHGSGLTPREVFPKEARWEMIRELCSIPKQFDLPVVVGCVERSSHAVRNPGNTSHDLTLSAQAIAATCCVHVIERYMREAADKEEVASLVYEDSPNAKKLIKDVQNYLKSSSIEGLNKISGGGEWAKYLPLERIVNSPHFAEKEDTSILQIADACAFAIKRKLQKAAEGDIFLKEFEGQMIIRPRAFDSSVVPDE